MQQEITQQKLLLVEDNNIAQKGAILVLSSLGYEIEVADCGEKAIALFKPNKYALIFMDVGLPDMKGYQVTERLREIEQGTGHRAPILGLSAMVTEEENRLGAMAGMDQMQVKPLSLGQTTQLLKQYAITRGVSSKHAGSSEENDLSVIDLAKIKEDLSAGRQSSCILLDALMLSLPQARAEIEQAFEAQDTPSLIEKVHKLHSGLCYANTPHLLYMTSALELSLKNGEQHKVRERYQDLLDAIALFEKIYDRIRLILPIYGTVEI